jgi:hypothetical protein
MDPSTPFKRLGPVSRLREFVTPVEDVHVLAHLGVAHVDPRRSLAGLLALMLAVLVPLDMRLLRKRVLGD